MARNGAMRPTQATTETTGLSRLFKGPEGSCARVTLSWVTAGGVAGGGILVGSLTIAGYVSPGLQLLAAPVLFLVGAFLGAAHGGFLAVVGRPADMPCAQALRRVFLACILSVPALGAAWVVTAGISLTAALVGEWRLTWGVLSLGGWLFGLSLCTWAATEGWRALRRTYRRWPEGRLATVLTTGVLVVTTLLMLRLRPGIWGTDLRLNGVGAALLALLLTLWVGLPLVWAVLHLAHDWLSPHPGGGEAGT